MRFCVAFPCFLVLILGMCHGTIFWSPLYSVFHFDLLLCTWQSLYYASQKDFTFLNLRTSSLSDALCVVAFYYQRELCYCLWDKPEKAGLLWSSKLPVSSLIIFSSLLSPAGETLNVVFPFFLCFLKTNWATFLLVRISRCLLACQIRKSDPHICSKHKW